MYFGYIASINLILSILILGKITPNYSQTNDFTSHLGAKDAKYKSYANLFIFNLTGIFLLLFSLFLSRNAISILEFFGAKTLLVTSLFWIGIGFFPFSKNDTDSKHKLFVDLSNYGAFITMVLYAVSNTLDRNIFGYISFLLAIVILIKPIFDKKLLKMKNAGLMQKFFIFLFAIWIILLNNLFI